MSQQVTFSISKTEDNKLRFSGDSITITVNDYVFADGKHRITDPSSAVAHFICDGKLYNVENSIQANTIEDWYHEELLPKKQMMDLLMS